jgi:hypothetical protein
LGAGYFEAADLLPHFGHLAGGHTLDTFETFMSDLLYEIYLARPETLKSDAPVKVKDVLDCADMQEFISRYAKDKLKRLQRGSVKEFIADNKTIKSLKVFAASIIV